MAQGTSSSAYRVEDPIGAIELYYEKGVTDGLPVVPPTEERVWQFLEAANREPDGVIGTVTTRGRTITADKVAINAVMAGCLPEYMPVVVTAIEAMCQPEFGLHGNAASTDSSAHMVIVHGPIARELKVNCKGNLFGPGYRANATIGRAIRLILMNVLGGTPGVLDKSTLGDSAKYSYCIAEDEELSPWEPLHVEKGLSPESSAVTVFAAHSPSQFDNHSSNTPEGILSTAAERMVATGVPNSGEVMIIISPELLRYIARENWSKKYVKSFLYEKSRRPLSYWRETGKTGWADVGSAKDDDLLAAVGSYEDIMVLVGGGGAGAFGACIQPWATGLSSHSVTKAIQI